MSIKISELPQASTVNNTDVIPIVQDGTTKKAPAELLKNMNYSTTEQVVGTWTDGKPIYRKVFTGTKVSGTAYQCQIDNFKNLINAYGYIIVYVSASEIYNYPIPYYEGTSPYVRYQINSNGVRLYSSSGTYINGNFTLVVEYTKTTD